MKLIKPKFEIIDQEPELEGIYKAIELAGRTCYKSTGTRYFKIPLSGSKMPDVWSYVHENIACYTKVEGDGVHSQILNGYVSIADKDVKRFEGLDKYECEFNPKYHKNITAKDFTERMIKSGHGAMLEHGTVYFKIPFGKMLDTGEFENEALSCWFVDNPYSWVNTGGVGSEDCWYVTSNYRVLIENDLLYTLQYLCEPTEFHEKRVTVHFVCDRGVSHEFVRHRVFSFAQESTRYCVAGDTLLKYNNPHWNYSIKDLYDKTKNSNGSWKRIKIENLDENTGELKFSKIKNIFYNGIKLVYELKTKLGYSLKCTLSHSIYTPNGYKELNSLKVGDIIYVNGANIKSECLYKDYDWMYNQNITLNKTFVQIAHEFNYNLNTIKKWAKKLQIPCKGTGYFNVGRVPWNKGMSENSDSRVKKQSNALREYHYDSSKKGIKILKEDTSKYQKHLKDACEVCGSKNDLEVHHINKNHFDNSVTNLMTVCSSCHQRIHNQSLNILHSDEIVSINLIGKQDVYDLEMENYSNYVANGIIVHNCNYSKDKFGNELTFIQPSWIIFDKEIAPINELCLLSGQYDRENPNLRYLATLVEANYAYLSLLDKGWKPEQARGVLPNALKTELVMTGFVSDWKHFFALRDDKAAHPDMINLAKPLHEEFIAREFIK